MLEYSIRRILMVPLILIIIVTIVFFSMRFVSGGPAEVVLGDQASESAIETFNKKWGLDRPLYVQYFSYMGNLLRGDLGESYISGMKIAPIIGRALPYSILLTISATILSLLIGIPVGVLSALKPNSIIDNISRFMVFIGLSMPDFYFGILLIMLFSLKLKLLPMVGGGQWNEILSVLVRLIMPSLTLSLASAATIMRITRSSVLDIIKEDYVRTAYSKGLTERIVLKKHVLRNALIPILSVTGINMGLTLGNVIIIEIVFTRPGLGKLLIGSVMNRDFMMIQSTIVIFAMFICLINLLTDLAYAFTNPRVKLN